MAAGFDRDAMLQQEQNFIAKLGFRLRIRHRDASAARLQKKRRGHARFAETDDQHVFVVQIHQVQFHQEIISSSIETASQRATGFQITNCS